MVCTWDCITPRVGGRCRPESLSPALLLSDCCRAVTLLVGVLAYKLLMPLVHRLPQQARRCRGVHVGRFVRCRFLRGECCLSMRSGETTFCSSLVVCKHTRINCCLVQHSFLFSGKQFSLKNETTLHDVILTPKRFVGLAVSGDRED